MYYDHEFVSNTRPGTNEGTCIFEVPEFNPEFDHDPVDKWIEVYETDELGNPTWGKVDSDAPCQECNQDPDDIIHRRRRFAPCGNTWTSVLHPPDQFRHWCSTLEAGGDCMHMEDY